MAYTTIDDSSKYFQTHIYTGDNNAGGQTITLGGNSDLQPDLTWLKVRNSASGNHYLVNSSIAENNSVHRRLVPNGTQTENDGYTDNFASDGFRTIDNGVTVNGSYNYVSWNWKCNGGSISASFSESGNDPAGNRQVNTTAGFSIMTWTGTDGSGGTVAHGLGAVPHFWMIKCRSNAHDWAVYHHKNTSAPETDFLVLNEQTATTDALNKWNDTLPTSTNITLGDGGGTNRNDETHTAFVWTSIQGFSKFGGYTGNASDDGPYVYLGFKPAWLMIKRTDATANWHMYDNGRNINNPTDTAIQANSANVEFTTSNKIDFLSNGFKVKAASQSTTNADGSPYVYAAWAENPFVTSTGIPCTAK